MNIKQLNIKLSSILEDDNEHEYDDDKDIIEPYKGFEIYYNAKERSVHIQNPKYGESAEVVAQTSNYTADNLIKAAKNIIDRGYVNLSNKRVYESIMPYLSMYNISIDYFKNRPQDKLDRFISKVQSDLANEDNEDYKFSYKSDLDTLKQWKKELFA